MKKHWSVRQGVWVETDQGVGITQHEKDGCWIHLVNDDGTTLAQIPAARCGNVRQASAASIPKPRIDHMSAEQLAALGYA